MLEGGVRWGGYPPRHGCCVQASDYIWDSARGGVLEGGGPGGCLPPPGTAVVSKHQTISGTQHEGACSRMGVRGGFTPPRHGCCVQAPDYIWDPARGGVLEGGGPRGGLPPPRHGCCVQASDSNVCICTQNHPSAKKSSFFVPWEAGGPSPN